MNRIFSNGGKTDFVINPFNRLIAHSSQVYLAAPFFTLADPVLEAANKGKSIQLLVGLNAATSPRALRMVFGVPGIALRYLTGRFHAKIYIFDDCALLGSSNLTDGGLKSNREAVICLDQPEDIEAVEDVRTLFLELWESAQVITKEKLDAFARTHKLMRQQTPDADAEIESAVGRSVPPNIDVRSRDESKERIFLEGLRREVYEQYRPAFNEVTTILEEEALRRDDLAGLGPAHETNRFLNFVRLTHVVGDEAWKNAPLRTQEARRVEILRFGREWLDAPDNKVPEHYSAWLETVSRIFGTPDTLAASSKDEITRGLMSLHAFLEQLRFVKGGEANLGPEFWQRNDEDIQRVKATLSHLLYGSGDFIERLHDIIYAPSMKLKLFGRFCALELYGTINPVDCPPMNGRMAKALRYLGFDVKGA